MHSSLSLPALHPGHSLEAALEHSQQTDTQRRLQVDASIHKAPRALAVGDTR